MVVIKKITWFCKLIKLTSILLISDIHITVEKKVSTFSQTINIMHTFNNKISNSQNQLLHLLYSIQSVFFSSIFYLCLFLNSFIFSFIWIWTWKRVIFSLSKRCYSSLFLILLYCIFFFIKFEDFIILHSILQINFHKRVEINQSFVHRITIRSLKLVSAWKVIFFWKR